MVGEAQESATERERGFQPPRKPARVASRISDGGIAQRPCSGALARSLALARTGRSGVSPGITARTAPWPRPRKAAASGRLSPPRERPQGKWRPLYIDPVPAVHDRQCSHETTDAIRDSQLLVMGGGPGPHCWSHATGAASPVPPGHVQTAALIDKQKQMTRAQGSSKSNVFTDSSPSEGRPIFAPISLERVARSPEGEARSCRSVFVRQGCVLARC